MEGEAAGQLEDTDATVRAPFEEVSAPFEEEAEPEVEAVDAPVELEEEAVPAPAKSSPGKLTHAICLFGIKYSR